MLARMTVPSHMPPCSTSLSRRRFIAGAGIVVTAAGNVYGRLANRPSALIRVPGIILLVPGSLGFRSFNFVFERDVMLGLDTAFAVLAALIALVAGILFGNLLVPPRRYL